MLVEQLSNLWNYDESTYPTTNYTIELVANLTQITHCFDDNLITILVIQDSTSVSSTLDNLATIGTAKLIKLRRSIHKNGRYDSNVLERKE